MKLPSALSSSVNGNGGTRVGGFAHGLPEAVILDVDGTLVDSNYQHTLAWHRAFAEHGVSVPAWRIHQHMGMGGDQLVESVAGGSVEARCGDRIRAAESSHYSNLMFEVRPFDGAAAVIERLVEAGHRVVLASSAKPSEVEHYLRLIGASPGPHAVTHGDEVDVTKPERELVERALAEADVSPDRTLMVGDSIWDVTAACRAGVESVAVRTGGFPEHELLDRGARAMLESVSGLPAFLSRLHRGAALDGQSSPGTSPRSP